MKFLIAKNDKLFCFDCKANILRGEHYVGIFYKRGFLGRLIRNRLIFHIECYRVWVDVTFIKKYLAWKQNLDPPKRLGRPRKYRNGEEANRLKTLIRHHREAGHVIRATELEVRLEGLKIC